MANNKVVHLTYSVLFRPAQAFEELAQDKEKLSGAFPIFYMGCLLVFSILYSKLIQKYFPQFEIFNELIPQISLGKALILDTIFGILSTTFSALIYWVIIFGMFKGNRQDFILTLQFRAALFALLPITEMIKLTHGFEGILGSLFPIWLLALTGVGMAKIKNSPWPPILIRLTIFIGIIFMMASMLGKVFPQKTSWEFFKSLFFALA